VTARPVTTDTMRSNSRALRAPEFIVVESMKLNRSDYDK
jgi:hypothetical protein